jgi:ABC-type sugar transport system substrate-binding protein
MSRKIITAVTIAALLFSGAAVFAGGGKEAAGARGKYAPVANAKFEKSQLIPSLELPVNLKKKVYYVESFLQDVAHRMMVAGAESALKQMGWDYEVLNPENDLQLQIKMIEDALAKGDMDGLMISAVDSEGIAATVKKVSDLGIPVVVVDRWPMQGQMLYGCGGDWYAHGKTATEQMVKLLKQKYNGQAKGKVVAMIIGMEINALRDRATAFRDVMKQYPNVKVVEKTAPFDPVKDAQILKDALLANPDTDAIWNIADVFGMNYVATLKEMGLLYPAGHPKHIILASMDGTDWALQEVRNGNFDSTVSSHLIEWGFMAAWALGQYYGGRGEKVLKVGPLAVPGTRWDGSKVVDMGNGLYLGLTSILVTKENVDDPQLWGNRVPEFLNK